MIVPKQTNGKKPRSVEMFVMPFNAVMQSIVVKDGPNTTEINLTNSQCEILIEVLQKNLRQRGVAA